MNKTTTEKAGSASGRRNFFLAGAGLAASALAAPALGQPAPAPSIPALAQVNGSEHWAQREAEGERVRLFLWRKRLHAAQGTSDKGTLLFVHGSSMAGTPTFDLQVAGQPQYSTMDHFARLGYDTWCLDCEGYGRSSKSRNINFDIANGAEDLRAASAYILQASGDSQLMLYGLSSGSLRAALFAERHPERVRRIALDAFVWTGDGSPTLANRRLRLDEWKATNRRPIDRAMVQSIFTRDHPGTADPQVVSAFADAILALDSSVPTGSYLDMSARLPLCTPQRLLVPVMIMRGQYDGIASFEDLLGYFARLPHPDKRFVVMPGIAHSSLHEKNLAIVYHTLEGFFNQPGARYAG
jgi:pimeloyl-ACP methyl ester carboxylesterase